MSLSAEDKRFCEEISKFVEKMCQADKTLRWTHLGSGMKNIFITFHRKFFRSKLTDIHKMVEREYLLYKDQRENILKTEVTLYQGLLSGRTSIINRTLSLVTLTLSIIAIIFSLNLVSSIIDMFPAIITVSLTVLALLLFPMLIAFSQDRLSVREFHIRIIVISFLLQLQNDKEK